MKRTVKIISLFLVTVMLALPFSSCSKSLDGLKGSELAFAVLEQSSNQTSRLNSYTMTYDGTLDTTYLGLPISIKQTGTSMISEESIFDFRYKSDMRVDITFQYNTTYTHVTQGYQDGTMYECTETNDFTKRYCSDVSASKYIKYVNSSGFDMFGFGKNDCNFASSNVDDGYMVRFTQFSDAYMEKIQNNLGAAYTGLFGKVTNFILEIKATEDLIFESIIYKMAFKDGSVFTNVITVSDINSTSIPDTDLSRFKNIDNLYLLNKIENSLTNLTSDTKFEYTTTHVAKYLNEVKKYEDETDGVCSEKNQPYYLPIFFDKYSVLNIEKNLFGTTYTVEFDASNYNYSDISKLLDNSIIPKDAPKTNAEITIIIKFDFSGGRLRGYNSIVNIEYKKSENSSENLKYSIVDTCNYY
jgi:hypothetical protein